MSKYNKYINNFANDAEYEAYINGSIAEVPNTALIDDTGEIKMTKYLPNNYVMFGTTTGTQDFMIGQSQEQYPSADCIQIHVVVEDESGINKMYVAQEDVLKIPKYFFSSYNGFNNSEGNKIVSIKKWKIDTSNVDGIDGMFRNCKSLASIDLSNFVTINVTSMGNMFYDCSSLTSLDLSNFSTSKVTSISGMFMYCDSLKSLNLSSFDTINATSMETMFYSCSNINKLYLSSSFFNSTSLTKYEFNSLSGWKDTESLAMFVEAITAHNGGGKTVKLTNGAKNELTTEQKNSITDAGWTIA